MSLWSELKRRNVVRVAAAYLVTGWLVVQAADVLVPALHLPDWMESAVVFVLIIGFPVALVFAWAYELTPEGLKRESEVERTASIAKMTGRKLDFAVIGLLAAGLVFFAFDKFVLNPQRTADLVATTTDAVMQEAAMAAASIDKSSIAVLPFVNMSADPEQEFFSDGLSEELLNVLAQLKGLRVAARTSSFSYKGTDAKTAQIAKELKVAHLLEGSVRKSGHRIRITAQLIEADSGFHLWSDTYDRELSDIFDIQDEIARAITRALQPHLGFAEGAAGSQRPVIVQAANPEAFEAYLMGRQLINKRGGTNIEAAVKALERSLQLDASYAPAHAQLAIATALLLDGPESYGNLTLAQVRARAIPHIERAFELTPNLAEAHGAMALLNLDHNETLAIEHAEKAVEQNPSYIDAWNWLVLACGQLGYHAQTIDSSIKIFERDPRSVIGRLSYTSVLVKLDRHEEAERVGRELASDAPWAGMLVLANVERERGKLADLVNYGLRARSIEYEQFSNTLLAFAFGWSGLEREAVRTGDSVAYEAALHSGRYSEAVAIARTNLATDPANSDLQVELGTALYFDGQLKEALAINELALAESPAKVLRDSSTFWTYPMIAIAHGRRDAGDSAGAEAALVLLEQDVAAATAAGIVEHHRFATEAMIAALRDQPRVAAEAMRHAIARGHRDPRVFEMPVLAAYADHPDIRDVKQELDVLLTAGRDAILKLICHNNPVPDDWRPLPETCAGG